MAGLYRERYHLDLDLAVVTEGGSGTDDDRERIGAGARRPGITRRAMARVRVVGVRRRRGVDEAVWRKRREPAGVTRRWHGSPLVTRRQEALLRRQPGHHG